MKNGKIFNPVDFRENLIEEYTIERIKIMERWIESLNNLIYIEDERKFKQLIHNDINSNVFADSFDEPKKITEPTKPWFK